MLQMTEQTRISDYAGLYERLIPKSNILRQMNDMVEFIFIYEELKGKYCPDNGRNAYSPIMMFKYLLLKSIYNMSNADLVERSMYDMSFKYFLGLLPEDDVIDSSSLTKFRKQRLKDENILDLLISKSVEIALEKGVIKSKSIIVDSTHTKARYNQKSAYEVLQEQAKQLRKSVYGIDESKKDEFPAKVQNGLLEDTLEYCERLIANIEPDETLMAYPVVKEKAHVLRESLDDSAEHLKLSKDEDARMGHKTADTSFFGYKTHMAMTDEGIITAATVTSGEKADGKELPTLIKKTWANRIEVETVTGDTAYSGKDNLEFAKENFELVSKLAPAVSEGNRKKNSDFEYNKDADMYVCPAGHMAIRKARQGKKNSNNNQVMTYYFAIEKCKHCPHRDGCYKEGAKSKTYSFSIKSDLHREQMEFQETEEFRTKAKDRYKIEAKNSELKHRHGYDVASSSGLVGMELQGATAIFVVNLKRIMHIMV